MIPILPLLTQMQIYLAEQVTHISYLFFFQEFEQLGYLATSLEMFPLPCVRYLPSSVQPFT